MHSLTNVACLDYAQHSERLRRCGGGTKVQPPSACRHEPQPEHEPRRQAPSVPVPLQGRRQLFGQDHGARAAVLRQRRLDGRRLDRHHGHGAQHGRQHLLLPQLLGHRLRVPNQPADQHFVSCARLLAVALLHRAHYGPRRRRHCHGSDHLASGELLHAGPDYALRHSIGLYVDIPLVIVIYVYTRHSQARHLARV